MAVPVHVLSHIALVKMTHWPSSWHFLLFRWPCRLKARSMPFHGIDLGALPSMAEISRWMDVIIGSQPDLNSGVGKTIGGSSPSPSGFEK